ncbi:TPA: ParB N-terminal domain-containing protein [Aeromonas salmonicida subsp. smithia]|uniref:ParB N-terminal domain-containing protein n=1 Tax=Aeromonas salmonicida TaxID=645 RepID=UPI0027968C4E|nr:ParB N-terminal domain-containing protein [Aeromonas salmonicida]MDQ1884343.1 ParB N-terminal domain-containing protein [Aeromonas salmonicida]
MAQDKKNWWEHRVLRSVDNLKLWDENPRLDASGKLSTVRDFVEELISDDVDAQDFIDLMNSIATRGFLSFDPVVVWQDEESQSFIVAEGNRRVMALKLLRSPETAPMSIRKVVTSLSRKIDRDGIEKIRVCLAPCFDDARWYILQRHSPAASNQVRWQRLQQQRFIISTYDAVGQDIDETIRITAFKKATIMEAIRYVKIRNIATQQEILQYLNTEEREQVYSHKISMTVLERWFGNSQVREAWHIKFDDDGVTINADMNSFYAAYGQFLKLMLSKNKELGFRVNTRTIDSKFQQIFDYLPEVTLVQDNKSDPTLVSPVILPAADDNSTDNNSGNNDSDQRKVKPEPEAQRKLKGNPKRRKFTDEYHDVTCRNYKLKALFKELQKLPIYSYPNVSAASIRIFLDLAVDEYIIASDLKDELIKNKGGRKDYGEITLGQRLSFLQKEYIEDRNAKKVIEQLLNASNDHSLNTLNEYVHGTKVHKVEAQFLNRFWDMLFPLFAVLINMREV